MKTLISPQQVVALAFPAGEGISPSAVTVADIAAAEARYIVPVIGEALHARLLASSYPDFLHDYTAPATALAVRLLLQPGLHIRTGGMGTVSPKSELCQSATDAQRREQLRALRTRLRSQLRRMTDQLETGICAEYNSSDNILNRCTINGGVVL